MASAPEIAKSGPEVAQTPPDKGADVRWCRRHVWKARLKEWLVFDSAVGRSIVAAALLAQAAASFIARRRGKTWRALFHAHRTALTTVSDVVVERLVVKGMTDGRIAHLAVTHALALPLPAKDAAAFDDPKAYAGSRLLVLKSATADEKGVVLMNYAAAYSAFLRIFDAESISERYYIVLETAWCGTCDESILPFAFLRSPVFVQTNEPRDLAFLSRFPGRLIPVETASNWWIDNDEFKPRPEVTKDTDLVMVATWASFKRHHEFFRALRAAKRRGRALSALLIGYGGDLSLNDIWRLARFYGVHSQLECHENIASDQVAKLINRAKLNVVWSRREGSNRAIIEGFLSDVPGIMRRGFNYGHQHSYMNRATGAYATEAELPDLMVQLIDDPASYEPRRWVMNNMSWTHAQRILELRMRDEAERRHEKWSGNLVGHFGALGGGRYVDPADAEKFTSDNEYLAGMVRLR